MQLTGSIVNPTICFLFVLLAILLGGCGNENQDSPEARPLVVGMDLTYPPFEMISRTGAPEGVSVDLAMALGEYLDRPVRIENIPFTGLIPSLQSKKVDIVISSMTDTPERRNSILFSDPYLTIGLAMLAGRDTDIQTAEDLDQPGRVVAVRQGTTGQVWANENIKNAKILVLEKENAAVLEVIQGKADAFVYDQMSVWKNAQLHPDTTRAILKPLQTEKWAAGLRHEDTELAAQVNGFFRDFREKGGFEMLGDKYLKDQKTAFEEKGLPFYF